MPKDLGHPLIGLMKGTVQLSPGTDLTDPAEPLWGMDLPRFKGSLADQEPPRGMSLPLQALWWAAKGDWDAAHRIVQDESNRDAAWVHAYLHRVEGDLGNVGYWYRQAGQPVAKDSLQAEWDRIAAALSGGE